VPDVAAWIPRPALDLCRRWEGLHDVRDDGLVYPYLCPAGVPTRGYGRTRGITIDGPPISKEEAIIELVYEVARYAADVYRLVPNIVNESDNRIGATISWCYNLGPGALSMSTMRRRMLVNDWAGAGGECRKWVMSGGRILRGLVLRREVEAIMIENG